MVPNSKSGKLAPIHVKSHKKQQIQQCSNQQCFDAMMHPHLANPAAECIHLKAATSAAMAADVHLSETTLKDLKNYQSVSAHTLQRCNEEQVKAVQHSAPLLAHADFEQFGYKGRMMYFSVFTDAVVYYSKFMRVRVTFDTVTGEWSCKCPMSSEKKSCLHEALAKWYVLQVHPSKLEKVKR